jgi:hypothetical protein
MELGLIGRHLPHVPDRKLGRRMWIRRIQRHKVSYAVKQDPERHPRPVQRYQSRDAQTGVLR